MHDVEMGTDNMKGYRQKRFLKPTLGFVPSRTHTRAVGSLGIGSH